MGKISRAIVYVLAAVGALFVGASLYVNVGDNCVARRIVVVSSPDKRLQAIHDIDSCDDLRSPRAVVHIGVVSAGGGERPQYRILEGAGVSNEIGLTWISEAELRVTYPLSSGADELFIPGMVRESPDLKVVYRAVPAVCLASDECG